MKRISIWGCLFVLSILLVACKNTIPSGRTPEETTITETSDSLSESASSNPTDSTESSSLEISESTSNSTVETTESSSEEPSVNTRNLTSDQAIDWALAVKNKLNDVLDIENPLEFAHANVTLGDDGLAYVTLFGKIEGASDDTASLDERFRINEQGFLQRHNAGDDYATISEKFMDTSLVEEYVNTWLRL